MLFTSIHAPASGVAQTTRVGALLGWILRATDIFVISAAGVLAWWLRFGTVDVPLQYQRYIAIVVLVAFPVFSFSRLYRSWRGRGIAAELWLLGVAYAVVFGLGMVHGVAFRMAHDLSRLWWLTWVGLSFAGAVGARVVARGAASWVRRRGIDLRTAVIVGGSEDARRVTSALRRQRGTGIRLHGWFDAGQGGEVPNTPHLGNVEQLARYVAHHRINQVWVALPVSAQAQINDIADALAHSTADIKFVPDIFGLQLLNQSVEQVAGMPVINLRMSPFDGDARLLKDLEDLVLATLILVLIAPLLALLALGVKLTSPGPVLFKQKRHGLDGKVIEVWKFRSMRVHQETSGHVTQATKHDPRVTAFGRFLRRTSLDELPQFINVLQGRMSIVGPRPHAVAHNHQFKDQVQLYMQRHRIKPGITGWAQVNGLRGETDTLDKMTRRVEYDLYYLQHWSLWFDLKIIAMTVFKGFLGKNAY